MQRLRAAQDTGESLDCDADNVINGLLHRERYSRCLCVKSQLHRAFVLCAKVIAHHPRPNATCGSVLGDFLKEVIMRVEEERDAWNELLDVEPGPHAPLNVFDSVPQCERKLLQ